ncbi:MAG TPA: hypothetical protein VGV41_22360 [Pseudolabrys sp.]|jgi:hypothetical protein|uniref:hypothetical protein n=1 Tax=Pseudolabrys sp. TaxID=1960880 RepID=UPI002DDC94A9|nr:hypothetical protein [Pseudolabrys sp.]HEV2631376.1 hypothetical protein [Pseudolabrys sp.]
MSETEQYLIDAADRCTRLARLGRELAVDLEAMSHELLAKAVEINTAQDRERTAQTKTSRS